ncbi:10463_t:CDS:2, partial [Dentiscutata erythropus]
IAYNLDPGIFMIWPCFNDSISAINGLMKLLKVPPKKVQEIHRRWILTSIVQNIINCFEIGTTRSRQQRQ